MDYTMFGKHNATLQRQIHRQRGLTNIRFASSKPHTVVAGNRVRNTKDIQSEKNTLSTAEISSRNVGIKNDNAADVRVGENDDSTTITFGKIKEVEQFKEAMSTIYGLKLQDQIRAVDMFLKMEKHNLKPGDQAYNAMFHAYRVNNDMEGAMYLLSVMKKRGLQPSPLSKRSLIPMLAYYGTSKTNSAVSTSGGRVVYSSTTYTMMLDHYINTKNYTKAIEVGSIVPEARLEGQVLRRMLIAYR
ncbi:hypothetical protein SARC_10454 [Sphaeroforma arctica JP610]|uniref:Pentacotripeptide-repeat region of PRORP domain-containing protein n=1 Tax=Sphaeroforma arctica JP610 TaxID=667725 RepID=A0A0L0FKV2_9EUKA|nr:hypothetical protein SARC_10454 [Sphaeroforma arctica JP610]KNC77076.1 hypothetical protein SARC_10454 [Sphaeroforma arctica JP610]|eukprot:XP_014150978.1 hypothetical protein SARC_10454 [Sphaeroforma arctica JP610]